MEPPDRKKRVLIVLAVLAGMVAFMGNFFWGMFKDIRGPQASGHPVSYIPQLMFGGFFLVMIVSVVFSVTRGLRQLQNPASAPAPRVVASGGGSSLFLLIFALFWSAIVLTFNGVMGHGIYKQIESTHYPSVTGGITHSELTSHRTSKGGISYNAVIAYTYVVGDQKYSGDRVRFGIKISSYATASQQVNAYPLGSAVPVFYNPANPTESLLSPGVTGEDFMGLLFMTPFNMVMFGLWLWLGGWVREHWFRPPAGGVRIISDGMVTRIRLPKFPALGWGLAATGGLGFIAIFIVGFSTNMTPAIPVVLATFAAVYGTGFGVYWWQRQKINSGIDDLLINEVSRSLELPLTYGRKTRITARVADIKSLFVEKIEHRGNKGGTSYTYAPTLHLAGTEPATQKLADWTDELKANEFTEWLRQKLGPNIPTNAAFSTPSGLMSDSDFADPATMPPASVEVARPAEPSRIQVTDSPGGREFYFPAARNLGTAFFTTVFMLVFNGAAVLMYRAHVPLLFPIVFGLVGVLLIFGTFNLWFKSGRITVNPTRVIAVNRWLIFSRTRQFDAGDIARFATKTGMQSGSTIFTDIKLVRVGADAAFAERAKPSAVGSPASQLVAERFRQAAGPAGVTVANSLASAAEAGWLVQEMNRALGRAA